MPQMKPSPLDKLLKSRGAQQGTFTSNISPAALPNDPFATVKASSQLNKFNTQLTNISGKIDQQRAAAEESIARQLQKKREEALMDKLRSLIPAPTPNLGGYSPGGGGPGYNGPTPSPFPMLPENDNKLKLPNINEPQTPIVSPPPQQKIPIFVPGRGIVWIPI